MTSAVDPGTVVWAWLDPAVGSEQSGRRPVLVVSSRAYNDVVDTLVVVVPLSRTARGWPNHVPVRGVRGLDDSYVMTEQPRTLSRTRVGERLGEVDRACLDEVRQWLADFLDL